MSYIARSACGLFVSIGVVALMLPDRTFAQTSSSSDVLKLVVPFPAGVTIDTLARSLAISLAQELGRPAIVDNRAGAAGNIGTEAVVNAKPDGNTLLVTVNSAITVNPFIYRNLKFDPTRDLLPVANLTVGGYVLVANPKLSYRTVSDLIKAAKAGPYSISFSSYGVGSNSHVCMEMLKAATGVRLRHVPYKSGSVNDLIGGHVGVGFENIASTVGFIKQSKLTVLALSDERLPLLPDVPAVAETLPGYACNAWVGVFAPKATPPAVLKQLSDAVVKVAGDTSFVEQATLLGNVSRPLGMEAFARLVKEDTERMRNVLMPLNIQAD